MLISSIQMGIILSVSRSLQKEKKQPPQPEPEEELRDIHENEVVYEKN